MRERETERETERPRETERDRKKGGGRREKIEDGELEIQ